MNKKTIPFNPLPMKLTLKLAEHFRGIGNIIVSRFSFLEKELKQAELDFDKGTYGAIIALLLFFILFLQHLLLLFLFKNYLQKIY